MDQQKSYVPEGKPFKFCSNCGAKIDKEALICPACGVSQAGSAGFGAVNYGQKVFAPGTEDTEGIKHIKNGSLLGILGIILGIAGLGAIDTAVLSTGFGGNPAAAISPLLILAVVGAVIGFISILFYRAGFRSLREIAPDQFRTPYTFTTVFLVGIALLVLGLLIVIAGAVSISLTSLLIGAVFVIIGAILVFLGDIIGIILGLWRVGTRYDNTLIKVGAIFFIIPYLDILAPILVFIGSNSVEHQIGMPSNPPPSDGTVM